MVILPISMTTVEAYGKWGSILTGDEELEELKWEEVVESA